MSIDKKKLRAPLRKWHSENLQTIFSNSRYRIAFLSLDFILLLLLIYFLRIIFTVYVVNLIGYVTVLIVFLPFIYLTISYFYRNGLQLLSEASLNSFIFDVRWDIANLIRVQNVPNLGDTEKATLEQKYKRYLQMDINKVRRTLKQYLDLSEIISPPIFNYELDRLQRGIDIFFNCGSETLFPSTKSFSDYQEMEKMQEEAYERAIENQYSEEFEKENRDETEHEEFPNPEDAKIHVFDVKALSEFMRYLGNVLYSPVRYYSPFSYRHPINLIELSSFFEHWNNVVKTCGNSKFRYAKAKKDVEEYYKLIGKTERQRTQRMRSLTDNFVIIVASVSLSAIVTYLMKFAHLG